MIAKELPVGVKGVCLGHLELGFWQTHLRFNISNISKSNMAVFPNPLMKEPLNSFTQIITTHLPLCPVEVCESHL